jgi:hypothetical protein
MICKRFQYSGATNIRVSTRINVSEGARPIYTPNHYPSCLYCCCFAELSHHELWRTCRDESLCQNESGIKYKTSHTETLLRGLQQRVDLEPNFGLLFIPQLALLA